MMHAAPVECELDERQVFAGSPRRVRLAVLVSGVIALVLLSPLLREVYASLGSVAQANVLWVAAAFGSVIAGFVCTWALQRLVLRTPRWSDVIGPHLAANAAANVLPAGAAVGTVIQLRMLQRKGIDLTRSVTSLAITGLLSTMASLLVFPVLIALPLGDSTDIDSAALARGASVVLFVCMAVAVIVLRTDRPMTWLANGVHRTVRRLPRCHPPADLAARIVAERDEIRDTLSGQRLFAAFASIGHVLGDFLALYAALFAVGLHPSPTVVVVAFVAANAAGMIPITPGGLGFVEAGLSGTLVLSGAGDTQALAAVAIYRLASNWLPIIAGVAAYVVSRRSATVAPAMRTSSSGLTANTWRGVPAAAHTTS